MVVIMVLLTLAVCLGIEAFRTKAKSAAEPQHAAAAAPAPLIELLFHPGHSWAQVRDAQTVAVGVDDFTQRFMGSVEAVRVKERGILIQQGEALATLRHKGRELTVVAPVSGVLTETNGDVLENPRVLNESPYERGWLAQIKPSRLEVELRNLLRGAAAERWREGLQAQMASWFAPKLGMVLQDGGEWADNLSDLLTDDEWKQLARTLYPVLPTDQSNQ